MSHAALATAGASHVRTRGSNGFGIRYSRPKAMLFTPYAFSTTSGTSSFASAARARAAAIFISLLMAVDRTSRAPRKMNGKPRTLFTWFG